MTRSTPFARPPAPAVRERSARDARAGAVVRAVAGACAALCGAAATATATAAEDDAPGLPVGASAWPAPGDPWPAPLAGPVTLIETEAGLVLADGADAGPADLAAPPTLGAALPASPTAVDAGACYAEVLVPASWRLEPVEVVTREPSERFEVSPPVLAEAVREVVVRDAHERLVPIAPVTRVDVREALHRPAGSRLVRGGPDGAPTAVPAAASDLEAVAAAGLDPEALAVGSCVHEWYEPPERRTAVRRVLVSEASERLAVEPARFEDVEVPVETTPAHVRLVEIPAAWREGAAEVLVEPARTAWVPGEGLIERIDAATGELVCRVDVPARRVRVDTEVVDTPAMVTPIAREATVRTLEASRLVADARELRVPVPARFETLELEEPPIGAAEGDWAWLADGVRPLESAHSRTGRSVCRVEVPAVTARWERESVVEPGRFERETVPAETVSVDVLELVAGADATAVDVPEEVRRLTRRTHLFAARTEWRPVLCRTNVTEEVVRRLQLALESEGHSPNGVDGLLGPGTMGAVDRYQRARGLPSGGLTLETLASLGVALAPIDPADARTGTGTAGKPR